MDDITRRAAIAAGVGAVAMAGAASAQTADAAWRVRSPNRRIEMELRLSPDAGAHYRILQRPARGPARVAVDWSRLGIVSQVWTTFDLRTPVMSDLSRGLEFVNAETTPGVDAYTMVTGKRRENATRYEQIALTFREPVSQRLFRIEARAYDEGAAFRYVLPETTPMQHWVMEEKTEFNIGLGATHWGQAYDFYTMYHPSYETWYDALPSGTTTPPDAGTGWGFPSLFERGGLWTLIHETNLDGGFQGSHLHAEAPGGVYRIAPPMQAEAMGLGETTPASSLPWAMPWRMFIVSDDIARIVESNLVFHLAAPSRVADTSWIRPGLASWNWLSDHASSRDLDKLRGFIDLAAEMGWPYTLIDANWNLAAENAMETLLAYANARNVGLLFWYNSGGRHNVVTEQPRNLMDDPVRRRAEFARLQALGVRGVKVDFLQSDKQDMIRLYLAILEDAADHRLMVNFHGSTIPRGWERTWPNLVSMEAVRGAEFYSFNSEPDYGAMAPRQNAIHPYLRNVIGSMDYTPTHFSQFDIPRRTTHAHEAALATIFESGIQHLSDTIAAYRALPPDWRAYLSEVPAAWDDTRFIAGAPGAHVVMARRLGARWYVAGVNGGAQEKSVTFELAALPGVGGDALVLHDDGAGGFGSRRRAASAGRSVTETMRAYGGFVMIFGA